MSTPTETTLPPDRTRATQRGLLLQTAERLFAERGVDAVSLRAVMAAAGTNVAAVHYHFGSKDALVQELIRTRSDEVGSHRAVLLSRLEQDPAPTVRGVAEAFVRPVAEMASGEGRTWVRFVYGVIADRHTAFRMLDEGFAPQAARLLRQLDRARPGLDQVTARFRMGESMITTFRVLGDLDSASLASRPQGPRVPDADLVEQLLDLVTAVLAGPPD